MLHPIRKIRMNWPTLILFAVIAGLYTGAVMLIPALKDTSFQDIGITYEWWVLFALLIVTKCSTSREAMLKCFVFFLISQPLVYGVEVLFGKISFQAGWYYFSRIWLPLIFLTLPGGFVAFYCKKQNLAGSLILGLGNTILLLMGVSFIARAVTAFPHHLLSAILCVVSVFLLSFSIQRQKKYALLAILVAIILTGMIAVYAWQTGRVWL